MASLTVRGLDMRWHSKHRYLREQPPGSNTDKRPDGIRAAQLRLGAWLVALAWCGVWAAAGLIAAGVKGVTYRLASVSLIEDDARAHRAPFRDWLEPTLANARRLLRGDLVVLFGRGVHVATFRGLKYVPGTGWCIRTEEGNTSSGNAGSQSDGGMSTPRLRLLKDAHGFARVDFPGGASAPRRLASTARVLVGALIPARPSRVALDAPESSDAQLVKALEGSTDLEAIALLDALSPITAA